MDVDAADAPPAAAQRGSGRRPRLYMYLPYMYMYM